MEQMCNHYFFQILHLDAGDFLELRMTSGHYISDVTLNIQLSGLD